jgi:hypothetical protein
VRRDVGSNASIRGNREAMFDDINRSFHFSEDRQVFPANEVAFENDILSHVGL